MVKGTSQCKIKDNMKKFQKEKAKEPGGGGRLKLKEFIMLYYWLLMVFKNLILVNF